MYGELVMSVFDAAPDIVTGVRDCFEGAAAVLVATDYADACPIETVALEVASSNEPLRIATAEVFESWIVAASARFAAAGLSAAAARELAIAFINLLEGAFVLARAARTTEALDAAGRSAVVLVESALAATRSLGTGWIPRAGEACTAPPPRLSERRIPLAGVAQWQSPSLPSWPCRFDPGHPLSENDLVRPRAQTLTNVCTVEASTVCALPVP